jgi:hypothetical protein
MTQEEFDEACSAMRRVIVPPGIEVQFNGEGLATRTPLKIVRATLPTVLSDEEGYIRRTERQTEVRIYEPLPNETPSIYELGIPVVETGDRWHVDVQQKVPLNMDRDNVTPGYLRALRTLVVNEMRDFLGEADANATFVNEALADDDATPEAIEKALELKYGKKRAVYDPSDPEANNRAVANGYKLIYGSQLNSDQWKNVKKHEAAPPAGKLFPTSKAKFSADGKDCWVPKEKWTPGMRLIVDYARDLAQQLLGKFIEVDILSDVTLGWGTCYGNLGLVFNLGRLGKAFFENGISDEVNSLLIHEFAHDIEENHLSETYHKACCDLGAKLARLALTTPRFFAR